MTEASPLTGDSAALGDGVQVGGERSDGLAHGVQYSTDVQNRLSLTCTVQHSTIQVYRTGYFSPVLYSSVQYRCTEPVVSHLTHGGGDDVA